MARLVYLPTVEPDSWLLWTTKGQGSCLRDYRFAPTREMRNRSTADIQKLLAQPGHLWEMADQVSYTDSAFWRDQVSLKNTAMDLQPIADVQIESRKQRLLSVFTSDIVPLLQEERIGDLESAIHRWIEGFASVVNKDQFNHWDNSDATVKASSTTGFGWTSTMLEYCRANGQLRAIQTGRPDLDFAVIAAEVALGISSKSNPFQPGYQDYIEPDALGIRDVDGSLIVLEMKGPQDDHDLLAATLQAFCGALAVFAKRQMIVRIAKTAGERRPAATNADVPSDRPSFGLYVVIVRKAGETLQIQDDPRIEPTCRLLKRAFPALRDAAYFIVDLEQLASIGHIPVQRAFP